MPVAAQNAVFDIVGGESQPVDGIGEPAEKSRYFANTFLDVQFYDAVDDQGVVDVDPEGQLFFPLQKPGQGEIAQKRRVCGVFPVCIRRPHRPVIDFPLFQIVEFTLETVHISAELGGDIKACWCLWHRAVIQGLGVFHHPPPKD